MPALTLANLVLYAAQAALLIGALALTLAALRPSPAVPPRRLPRRARWRSSCCRCRCWLRETPTRRTLPAALASAAALAVDGIDARGRGRACRGAPSSAACSRAGIALRLLWLGVGLTRLRRLARLPDGRRHAAITIDGEVDALQAELGTRARVAFVDRVAPAGDLRDRAGGGPAAGGAPRRVSGSRAAPSLCHELLHVRRRDWLWVLGGGAGADALLWFHPAVWWLVGELQLAREQVVDRLTVAATGARRDYMDALFSAADLPSAPPLLSGFLRRRHLARRLVSLAEEVVMSRARLVAGGVLMVAVLLGGGAVALSAVAARADAARAGPAAD